MEFQIAEQGLDLRALSLQRAQLAHAERQRRRRHPQPRFAFALCVLAAVEFTRQRATERAAPQVVTGLKEAMPTAQLLHRQSGHGFPQEADDLHFRKALPYVQSPQFTGSDS